MAHRIHRSDKDCCYILLHTMHTATVKYLPISLTLPLTLSPPIPLRLYTLPYWSNPLFFIFNIWVPECQKIKNSGLDQYGVEPFEQQQFGTAGIKGVNCAVTPYPCNNVTLQLQLLIPHYPTIINHDSY